MATALTLDPAERLVLLTEREELMHVSPALNYYNYIVGVNNSFRKTNRKTLFSMALVTFSYFSEIHLHSK